jgi:hypothetical protein
MIDQSHYWPSIIPPILYIEFDIFSSNNPLFAASWCSARIRKEMRKPRNSKHDVRASSSGGVHEGSELSLISKSIVGSLAVAQ